MRLNYFTKPEYRVLFMLAEFIFLLVCIIYIDYIYLTKIRPDQRAKLNFVQTDCLIMSKKLSTKGHLLHRYRADFLVSYQAKGAQYTRWVSGNGLDMTYYRSNEQQKKLLSDFKDGNNYICWYNPQNPDVAMLVQRDSWTYWSPFIWPGLAALVAFILAIKNVWYILRLLNRNKIKI